MENANCWQIGAGSFGRDYRAECFKFGMAFVGGEEHSKTMQLVRPGELVVLRKGMEFAAAGTVVERNGAYCGDGDKEWTRDFDGWDLRAWCYVDWHIPLENIDVKGLTRTTMERVRQDHLIQVARSVIMNSPQAPKPEPEPAPVKSLEDEEIIDFLISQGLRSADAEDLAATFRRIRRLANYYWNHCDWKDVREHEARTFLVVPLLLALGWAEQQIKIEYSATKASRADLALFSRPYPEDDARCVMVLETKGFDMGLTFAQDQVKEYAKEYDRCRTVVATNGYCYKAFTRLSDGSFPDKPSAYLNLLRPKDRYPLDPEIPGGLEMLRLLQPSGCRDEH
ncbi:MAG TPA: type I restriction enzyme HsdR N-terminal domain-containing protein [Myxococcota bacterium]|nr:type I restriction enzyme HsdR N-terminal domain-containing protein [Myxococcota bacterium]HRY97290.1 type I restriction enzyme HsdR N-terminal domain-containing protein [Myxococcota bacterium]